MSQSCRTVKRDRSKGARVSATERPRRAFRIPQARHELVENCGVLRVSELLAQFGPPVFDQELSIYVCRVNQRLRFELQRTRPSFGGTRWWLLCPGCHSRCANLYSPRDVKPHKLRCRLCWGLKYRSQLK